MGWQVIGRIFAEGGDGRAYGDAGAGIGVFGERTGLEFKGREGC